MYRVKFIEALSRTPTVKSFRFVTEQNIDFLPGQFLKMIFDKDNENNKELNKYLSFSCGPGNEYIEVTKRLSSSLFSKKLNSLKIQDELFIDGPLGNCVYKDTYKKIGFLIGGIGITPVISIIEYIIDRGMDTDVCLLYANRTEEETAFRPELDAWSGQYHNIRVHYVVSDILPKNKSFTFGKIDTDFIKREAGDFLERVWFIFGPPKMVEAMAQLCLDLGIKKEYIKTENFIGY